MTVLLSMASEMRMQAIGLKYGVHSRFKYRLYSFPA